MTRAMTAKGAMLLGLVLLGGCAHSFYYVPEIQGNDVRLGRKNSIVTPIPATGPAELTVRVRAIGVWKSKNVRILGMRMSFTRPAGAKLPASGKEFLDPTEQLLKLEGGQVIHPAFVRTKARKDKVIALAATAHEVVELLYPLPLETRGAISIPTYTFDWKVHYGAGKTEAQTVRFDRFDAADQQAAEVNPEDSDYPYDVSPMEMPGWQVVRDQNWWPLDPWWPMY